MSYHLQNGAITTISIYTKDVPISLGVLELSGESNIVNYIEKSTLKYKLSTGIYIFNKRILGYIKRGKYLDLPDIVRKLIREGENIRGYMFEGYWMDMAGMRTIPGCLRNLRN